MEVGLSLKGREVGFFLVGGSHPAEREKLKIQGQSKNCWRVLALDPAGNTSNSLTTAISFRISHECSCGAWGLVVDGGALWLVVPSSEGAGNMVAFVSLR